MTESFWEFNLDKRLVFFFFFFLLLLKGQIVNIWGSVGLQLLNSAMQSESSLELYLPNGCGGVSVKL